MSALYFKVFSLPSAVNESQILPEILAYSKRKYGDRYIISAYCWQQLLNEYKKFTNKLLAIDFNAKSIVSELKKYNLSVSHSNDACAFAFIVGEEENFPLGIDVERVSNKKNQRFLDFLNLDDSATESDFLVAFTKYESAYKALGQIEIKDNLKRGERYIKAFNGNTFIREIKGERYIVSIFNKNCVLEEIK